MAESEKDICGSVAARQTTEAEQKWICTLASDAEQKEIRALCAQVQLHKNAKIALATLKQCETQNMDAYRNDILPSQFWYGDRVWCEQFEEGLREKAKRDVAAQHKKEVEKARKQAEQETRAKWEEERKNDSESETAGQLVSRLKDKIVKKVSSIVGSNLDTIETVAHKADEAEEAFRKGNLARKMGDYAKAVQWYRKAAELGHVNAQCCLGGCYRDGQGVKKDNKQSAYWYLKAAAQGNAYAQAVMGNCYEYGRGVDKNYTTAAVWYSRAAVQGDDEAAEALLRLQRKGKI